MWYEWVFDGIGSELISLIIGIIVGIVGEKAYQNHKNKHAQKAGDHSSQIQVGSSGITEMTDSNIISVSQHSAIGDTIVGDKIVHKPSEYSIENFKSFSNSQIEDVIAKGNDATVRVWCLELIINDKQEYLIRMCLDKMSNDSEKYKLLEALVERNFCASDYCRAIEDSIENSLYLFRIIMLYLSKGLNEYIPSVFIRINNNKYIYDSLLSIHPCSAELFESLYEDGHCFTNDTYRNKMREWIELQNHN